MPKSLLPLAGPFAEDELRLAGFGKSLLIAASCIHHRQDPS
jgi:hypothetical protein